MASIELRGVSHRYPDGTLALRDIDLAVESGALVAITGPNGSGKSTLVSHMNGLLRPTAGAVLHDGRDIAPYPVAQLVRAVGLVTQHADRQVFATSVQKEVEFGARNLGLRGIELQNACREALQRVGIQALEHHNPYEIGYSKRRLLAIASVLAMRTPVVVLDEPVAGLDLHGLNCVRRMLRELIAAGRTAILVTNDVGFARGCAARMVALQCGSLVR